MFIDTIEEAINYKMKTFSAAQEAVRKDFERWGLVSHCHLVSKQCHYRDGVIMTNIIKNVMKKANILQNIIVELSRDGYESNLSK